MKRLGRDKPPAEICHEVYVNAFSPVLAYHQREQETFHHLHYLFKFQEIVKYLADELAFMECVRNYATRMQRKKTYHDLANSR